MSTRLVILGILREKPLHGYEIKRIIEQRMGDWTSIAFGSIYFALAKLAEEGMIRKVETRQEGNRPSRSVFEITAAGEKAFLRLLREAWLEIEHQYFSIDLGIAFMNALPKPEIKKRLARRIAQLETIQEHIARHREEQLEQPDVPAWARSIFDHSTVHFASELAWTRELLDQINRGKIV
ncbi:MAG: PadR family transcriptional regulator [Spirochaetia bacterium]